MTLTQVMPTQIVGGALMSKVVDAILAGYENGKTRRAYSRALGGFMEWWMDARCPPLTKMLINEYKQYMVQIGIGEASINQRITAIKRLALELADHGVIDERTYQAIKRVEGIRREGRPTGNWLTQEQAQALLNTPDVETLQGLRDRALFAILLGCGLRRDEAAHLQWSHIAQREGRWCIVDMVGKRNKVRTIPMAPWTKVALDRWGESVGGYSENVFVHINKGDNVVGESITGSAVNMIVKKYCAVLGFRDISAHDLRRTFAKLARKGGALLEHLQYCLGHQSVETTAQYIGEELDYNNAPCDVLGIGLES